MSEHTPPRAPRVLSLVRKVGAGLTCLWILWLLTAPLSAQTEQETKYAEAERLYARAAGLYQKGDRDSLAEAVKTFQSAALLYHSLGKSFDEAVTLSNIGLAFDDLGERVRALDSYLRALPLIRAAGDRKGEAATLKNIGADYSALGEKQKALEYYFQALPIKRELGDGNGEGATLNNIGRAYDDLGEKQKALDYYSEALPFARAAGDRNGEATILNNIGSAYDDLGEKQEALGYYARSLPIFLETGSRGGQAMVLGNVGAAYFALGEKQKALDYYARALPLTRALGDRGAEATTLNNIGLAYVDLGERQKALDSFNEALPLYRAAGHRKGEATALNNIGLVNNELGARERALDYYSQALPLYRAVGDRAGEAGTLYNLSALERARGNLTVALTHVESAVSIVEALRVKIGSRELRSSYFATVQNYYELYVDLLMQLHKLKPSEGFDGRALQASERGRARSLLESLAEANADIRQGVAPELLARERELQRQLNAAAQEQLRAAAGGRAGEEAAAKKLDALADEYRQNEARIRQDSPHYAALTQPRPLSLEEIQGQVLDKDTLLLQYSLGAERSYLWAVTRDSVDSFELPRRAEIEDAARAFYATLADARKWTGGGAGAAATPEAAERLSRMILAPAAKLLGGKRLVVVADGALQFIPFAALPTPDAARLQAGVVQLTAGDYRPLIVEHEVVSLPSASTLAVLRGEVKGRSPAPKLLAVLADPVFERSDPRLKGSAGEAFVGSNDEQRGLRLSVGKAAKDSGIEDAGPSIPRLPGTRKEAEQILALALTAPSRPAFDFTASRATATDVELGQYRYVHFATHGFLDSRHPELSGVLLSMFDERGRPQDGFLRAHEFYNLKLSAELVVLSACQTGLGKEVRGEGLVGLTRGIMYAGAPRVVVSLWDVSDAGTAELMTRFYRGMLKEGKRPAEALRAAQVSMLGDERFAAPYFWAAFTLQGEWR